MSKISAQDLASYAAVIVASVALYVGWDQARIGRNQQHADVFPVVQLRSHYVVEPIDDDRTVRHLILSASNEGVGPAFIGAGKWSINGESIERVSDLSKLFPEKLYSVNEYQGGFENFLIGAGESEVIWDISWPNTPQSRPLIEAFMKDFWKMDLEVCYCSLYERCWMTQYNAPNPRPTQVKSCPE